MAIPISNVTRRVVYAASGTGPYAFTFEILANTDIAVYKDDTLLTLTTDYTVTIASNGTGSITLVAAPTGATQIAIVGNRTIQRTTDFVTGGDFFANTVNDEMDQQTIFAQQNAEGLRRALSAPQTDPTSINMTLPRASLRANKALGFDADGNPAIADTLGTNRGNWAASTLYYVRDIVKDTTNSNIWQCIVQHTSSGSQPINTNTDSAKWTLLVDAAAAATSASNAASSASAASTSASNAASSASAASTSASNASTSASNASSSASAAASSASSAAASYDSFDDRYLGAKSSNPTLDNDSNALIDGALYFDTTNNVMKVYDLGSTTWKRTTPTTTEQTNIDSAVANATNINTVAGISANVTTVATNNANVTTVAGSIASVNTNATNIANINTNAANITAIQNASANATSAAASATTATTQAASAAASAAAASAVALDNEPVRPGIRPSLLLDFANTKQLDPRITFTRASTATYYGTQTAKAEENLLLQSQTFDNASWTKSNAAVSGTDTIVAPDGTTTAEEVRDGTASAIHNVFQGVTLASGTTYVASVFLKNVDRQYAMLAVSGGVSAYASAKFDLTGGTSTANQAAGSGWSVTSVAMTSVGSGWYRCVLVFVSGTSGSCNVRVGLASNGTTFTTNGSGLESYTGTDLKIAVWGAQLEQRSSVTAYTATTTAPITNYIPVLETAASGVARFDHNPTTFESLGLEIEESRTNTILQSEDLSTTWTATRATLMTNSRVSPSGAITADKIIASTDNNTHFVSQTFTGTAASWTFSVYAKAVEYGFIALRLFNGTSQVGLAYYNLSTGATGTVTAGTASITSVGNGWYRCVLTATLAASASCTADIQLASADNTNSFTGNSWNGVSVWGTQVELGAFPTSYIPTVASQVTRAADAASMTGTNFSSWYNQAESSFYTDFAFIGLTGIAGQRVVVADDGTASNYIGTSSSSTSIMQNPIVRSGTTEASLSTPATTFIANTFNKISVGFKNNDSVAAVNNVLGTADTLCLLPLSFTTLRFGASSVSTNANVLIRKFAYYPLRLTNTQLQAMTTV